jgi:hypothetical protein
MERLLQAIETMGGVDAETIKGIVNLRMNKICLFCDGLGHTPHQCATKKILDRIFRTCECSISWGRIKSSFMTGDVLNRVADRQRQHRIKKALRQQKQVMKKSQEAQMEDVITQKHIQARGYN